MTVEGWVKLHRQISLSEDWLAEPFTRGQAWVDLIMLANHRDGYIRKRGILVNVDRGQVGYSEDALAERWQWSRGKVRRFLSELEKRDQISHSISSKTVQKNSSVSTLITITNYDKYQSDGTENSTEDSTENGTENGTGTRMKRMKKKHTAFIAPSLDEVKAYCKERKNAVDPEAWIDHYSSNGWKVGKNPMKDWKAAVRTWERSSYAEPVKKASSW